MRSLCVDNVYIADTGNNCIRKLTVSTGIITTIAGSSTSGAYGGDGGAATSASLNGPIGIALDSAGTTLYPSLPPCITSHSQVMFTSPIRTIIGSARL